MVWTAPGGRTRLVHKVGEASGRSILEVPTGVWEIWRGAMAVWPGLADELGIYTLQHMVYTNERPITLDDGQVAEPGSLLYMREFILYRQRGPFVAGSDTTDSDSDDS